MLPLETPWYRKLLIIALLLGVTGGVSALIYSGITNAGIEFFFGGSDVGLWTGNWWWIPLTAVGGLLVAALRKLWKMPQQIPGSIALAEQAWVEPSSAPYWVVISGISLIVGASLGPSFALIVMGGAFGSWVVTRLKIANEEAKQEYTLTGMAGGLGAAFSAPLFASILASELSPTSKRNYVAAFIPALFAATIGYIIFFGITGATLLEVYELPPYEFNNGHLLMGVLLGVLSAIVLILFALVKKLVATSAARITNPYVLGLIGGALVGLIAFALPLTATSGSSQLATQIQASASISAGLLTAILFGKMFAVALSQASGFLGGVVFPIIFLGGTAGMLVHSIFPQIPLALCVGAMLAAVPGAFLNAPVSLVFIAVGTVSIGLDAITPIAIAVAVAHLTISLLKAYVVKQHDVPIQAQDNE